MPDDLTPDELTLDKALELLAAPKSDEPIGELDGLPVFAKNGRYGPYVQWGTPDEPPPGLDKPKMSSLFKTMVLERITMDEAEALLHAAADAGHRPGRRRADPRRQRPLRPVRAEGPRLPQPRQRGAPVHGHAGRGAARSSRSPRCTAAAGRTWRPRARSGSSAPTPSSERPVVAKDGKFGVYVTDGETNASIGKGDRIEEMLPERAFELLAIRREAVAAKGGAPAKRAARKAPAKKAPAKKAAAKKAAAKKSPSSPDGPA